MALERIAMSVSQFCELTGFDPATFVGVEINRPSAVVTVLTEETRTMQTSGTFPAVNQGGTKTPPKGKPAGRKGC